MIKNVNPFIIVLLIFIICSITVGTVAAVNAPEIEWQNVLGGSDTERGTSIQQTSDGGYIVTGYTYSSNTGDVGVNHGDADAWVVKLTSTGTIDWQNVLGGSNTEAFTSIQQTSEGGYIGAGETKSSNSGDVGVNHGDMDAWVVKLTPTGTIDWQKVLKGNAYDDAWSIQRTTDEGYIILGTSYSNISGDVGVNHGDSDIWVVKLTSTGTIDWQRLLGGSGHDIGRGIDQTSDGGYIVSGITGSSYSGDVGQNHGAWDLWVVKLTSTGVIDWQKVLGGSSYEMEGEHPIQQTSDGGYINTGYTWSSNTGDVGQNHGGVDAWVVKLTSAGEIDWQETVGDSDDDYTQSVRQTSNGGFFITGWTGSDWPDWNVWAVKLSTAGATDWQKVLGGSNWDFGSWGEQTNDGGFIITGYTESSNTGDVGTNHGGQDVWVVKLNEHNGAPEFPSLALPLVIILGFLGIVLYFRRIQEG